jgi:outer membrane immunogenic protein
MNRQFTSLFLLVAAIGIGPAFAADMAIKAPPPPVVSAPFNWTGFYLGANGGYG